MKKKDSHLNEVVFFLLPVLFFSFVVFSLELILNVLVSVDSLN